MSPERKKIFVLYDEITSIDREARNHPMVTNREEFNNFLNKLHILEALDGSIVRNFDTLEEGGQYRAMQDIDLAQKQIQVSDQALEMETAAGLETIVKKKFPNAHVHHNVHLREDGDKNRFGGHQYDALVHGDIEDKTFAVLLEVKSKVHPTDIDLVLKKADDLRSEIANYSKFAFTSGHHYPPAERTLQRYACIAKNIIPLRPSGSRFSVGARGALKLLKQLK
jgi:hypothetical protein